MTCDAGQVAVGGGADPDNTQVTDVKETHPTADGTGWTATVGNNDVTAPHGFDVVVLCVAGTSG